VRRVGGSARLVPLADVDPALAVCWADLAEQAIEPNVFLHPDFVRPAARRLGDPAAVALATVQRGGQLCFALPVVRRRGYRRLPVPTVTTWQHAYGYLGTPLVAPGAPEEAWCEALRLFGSVAPLTALGQLGTDGPVARALTAALAEPARATVALGRRERPAIRRRDQPTYISGKRRATLRRRRRQLAEALGDEVRCVDHTRPGPALDAEIEAFLAMEADGWKGRSGGAMACRPGDAAFFRDVCRGLARRGAVRLLALEVGGRPVAHQCVLYAGRTAFGFKSTYDERLRRYGPGTQLLDEVLTRFHEERRLDLLDSCTGLDETLTHEFFPDRRTVADLLLPPAGRVGDAVAWALPRAAAAYRRVRGRPVGAGR
jgi:Acetyltransferase (GNAT) domain